MFTLVCSDSGSYCFVFSRDLDLYNLAINQLLTSSNYSLNNKWFSWLIGGLNYQIEHHLFPNICHVHYHEISKIVKRTAEEYNLPYHASNTFISALKHHYLHLKEMSR